MTAPKTTKTASAAKTEQTPEARLQAALDELQAAGTAYFASFDRSKTDLDVYVTKEATVNFSAGTVRHVNFA